MTHPLALSPLSIPPRVAIVGLGLMGGSLALALHGRVAHLTAIERHAATRQYALHHHMVDAITDNLALGVQEADLIILATPVRTILHLLAELPALRPEGCAVLDLGSTKAEIEQAMEAMPPTWRAMGGHPMCGKEVAGVEAAEASLFQDKTFILCPNGRTDAAMSDMAQALVTAVGARPLFLPAAQHDHMVAAISHLPYLAASVLMRVTAEQATADGRLWQVSASGFRDTSRLAGSDPAMLRDILLTNREAVLAQLGEYQGQLAAVAELIAQGDETTLAAWLQARQAEYAAYRRAKYLSE